MIISRTTRAASGLDTLGLDKWRFRREDRRSVHSKPLPRKIGYGDIRKFADSTRFHLSAAHRLTNILFVSGGPTEETIDRLLRQLEIGLPAQALGLVDIPADLTRGDYLALLSAGIQNPAQVWQRTDEQLSLIVGPLVGRLLSSKRPKVKVQTA